MPTLTPTRAAHPARRPEAGSREAESKRHINRPPPKARRELRRGPRPFVYRLASTRRHVNSQNKNVVGRRFFSSLVSCNKLIEFCHLLFGIGNALRPGADAGLNLLWLGHDVNQIFFLFFELESAPLSGKPRDNNGSIRRLAFPLFQYLELHSLSAGVSQADPVRRWNADLDDSTSKHRRRPFQSLGSCRRRAATARLRLFR